MSSIVEVHYRRNYSRLVKTMIYRVGDNSLALAEEVVQEAYCRAIKYFKKFDPERGEFEQWFSVILNNTLNQCKKDERHRGVNFELDACEDWYDMPEALFTSQTDVDYYKGGLERAINNENARDREILSLFFFDGFGSKEIGEWLNMNNGTVRQVINRFRERIINEPKGLV